MKEKQSKAREILKVAIATVTAVALFGGALWGVNIRTLHAATDGATYLPQTVEYVSIPDNPVPEDTQDLSFTLANITPEHVEIHQMAMSMDEAALVGARYIYDVFGECIDGMYIEFEFQNWDHMTRTIWFGVVSDVYRNSAARIQRSNELHEEFLTRFDAGVDLDATDYEWRNFLENYPYIPGRFYFSIDAITGERIDILRQSDVNRLWTREMSAIIEAYVDRVWDGNWGMVHANEIDPAVVEEFSHVAAGYAQRHFNNTVVVGVEFGGASTFLTVDDNNGVVYVVSLVFQVTDDTGRVASTVICQTNRTLNYISTMRNDMLPFEFEFGYDWYEYESEDGGMVRRRIHLTELTEESENTIRRELVEIDENYRILNRREQPEE